MTTGWIGREAGVEEQFEDLLEIRPSICLSSKLSMAETILALEDLLECEPRVP